MAGGPYTREAWNEIIDRVNDLCENPPEDSDCEPIEPLEHVDPEHIWTTQDIDDVRQKLMEICKDNTFNEELDLWKQATIDEIEEAISNGWCDCEQDLCYADIEETILYSGVDRYTYIVVPHYCETPSGCPSWTRDHFDYYTPATAATGFGPGIGGTISVQRKVLSPSGGVGLTSFCYGNGFVCDGSQELPLPAPQYDSEGNLRNSSMATDIINCLRCSVYAGSSWLGWCQCNRCWLGMVGCCSSAPPAPPYPCWTPPPCPCTLDEGYVRGWYGDPEDYDGNTILFVMTKRPDGYWSNGRPCLTCCSDGIHWCNSGECPDDPACGEEEQHE